MMYAGTYTVGTFIDTPMHTETDTYNIKLLIEKINFICRVWKKIVEIEHWEKNEIVGFSLKKIRKEPFFMFEKS